MIRLEKLWRLLLRYNILFILTILSVTIIFFLFKTIRLTNESREILKKLVSIHIEKESIRIADEIYLNLETISHREDMMNEFLNSYGRLKLKLVEEKSNVVDEWIKKNNEEFISKNIYFGEEFVACLNISIKWNSYIKDKNLISTITLFMMVLIILLTITYILGKKIKSDIFDPTIDQFEKQSQEVGQYKLAKQVAHDIKSPLAALEIVMDDIKNLPEDSRELTLHAINRIQDIANNLSKQKVTEDSLALDLPSVLIRSLVNEKKIEYQNSTKIKIELQDHTKQTDFVSCIVSDLMRVLSNIINNSIDAINKDGIVQVTLSSKESELNIEISDTGSGFPQELLSEGIAQGRTIGKKDGQGLGLYHAKETINKLGGSLVLSNSEAGGASVHITIPIVKSPNWFKESINISKFSKLLIIDDDQSIHDVWNKLIKASGINTELLHLYKDEEISSSLANIDSNTAVLIDYDLRAKKTGIDYILNYNLKNVVLVTSNYDTPEVIKYCEDNGIQMIPKQIVSSIQIN